MTIFLGEKIKNLRQEKKISQLTLSNKILSRSTLSKIETNKVLPSLEQLIYLAEEFNVSISYFFDNSDLLCEPCGNYKALSDLYENKKYFDVISTLKDKKTLELIDFYFIGMSYFNIGVLDISSKNLKKFISQYKIQNEKIKTTYVEQVALALNTLSKILLHNKNYHKALKYLLIANNYLNSYYAHDKKIYFIINNNISGIYGILKEYCRAKEYLEHFLNKNTDLHYNTVMSSIYINLNIFCFNLQLYDSAIEYVKKAIFYYNLTNRLYDEGESYLNFINALRYLYKFEDALNLIHTLVINSSYPIELIEIYKVQNLIIMYNSTDLSGLLAHYQKINFKLLRKQSLMDYYFICGYIEYNNSNFKKSHANFLKCEKYLLKNNRYLDLSVMYNIFAEILDAEEYKVKAKEYKDLYYSSNSSLSVNITLPD